MNVYAIRGSEKPKYKELILDLLDIVSASPDSVSVEDIVNFSERNLPMQSWWKPLRCHFSDEATDKGKDKPDIAPWAGATLLLSQRAYDLLKDSIEPFESFCR